MAVEKLLPQNVQAEADILGSVLIGGSTALGEIADFLQADDFYREAHRLIYQAALDVDAGPDDLNLTSLIDELARRGKLEDAGGGAYVSSLANQVPTYLHIKTYARIVEREAILRRLIQAAGQIAAVAYNEPDADDALEESEKLLDAIRGDRHVGELRALGKDVQAYWTKLERVQEVRKRGEVIGVPSGFSDQDRITAGFQKSDLYLIAGRPSVGKTSYLLSMVDHIAVRKQIPVGIFSLEMPAEQLIARLVSMHSGVDLQHLRTGHFNDDAWEPIIRAIGIVGDAPIYVDDTPGISLGNMRTRARRMVHKHGVQVIFLDYLQLMDGSGSAENRKENRQQEVSAISRGLKGVARELNVPLAALSQLSRAVEARADKKPQLSDLRESGSLEQDSDAVLLLYRDEMYNPDTDRQHIVDVEVAKQRNGPTGRFSLYFQATQTRYRDLDLGTPDEAAHASVETIAAATAGPPAIMDPFAGLNPLPAGQSAWGSAGGSDDAGE